jgi:hypothetical protein
VSDIDLDDIPMVLGRPMYYRLGPDHEVLPATRRQMYEVYEGPFASTRQVARDEVGEQSVSTVFLGIDHSFSDDGPPIIFETMIFGGPFDEYQWRYATWDEAAAGHKRLVKALIEGRQP